LFFSWNNDSSQFAAICMAVTRVNCAGMDIDSAIRKTLKNGFCRHPECISDDTLRRLRKEVSIKLEYSRRKPALPAG